MRKVAYSELMSKIGLPPGEYRPGQVLWDLTYACQLRCTHCYQMNLDWNVKMQLPTQRIIDTLDELKVLGTTEVVFSGGDPFIRKDFLDIVDHAGNHGFQIVIYTSGVAINAETSRRLKKAKVSWIEVTLMGADADTHDTLTQRPKSFDKLIATIVTLRDAGVHVVAKTVVTKQNLPQLQALMQLANDLGVEYKCDPHMWRPWNGTETQIDHLKLNDDEMREFYTQYRDPKPQDRKCAMGVEMCNAGNGRLGITPFGKVNPCTTYGEAMVIGDLHKQSISEIWLNSPSLKKYRERTSASYPKCNDCTMAAFCDWCPGLSTWAGLPAHEPYPELCHDTEIKMSLWEKSNSRSWVPVPVLNRQPVS